ncbi:hypothetical protein MBLNU230_g0558t1 [Neophaeotheca triangularis]
MLANPTKPTMARKPVPSSYSQQTPASYTDRGHSRTRTGSSNVLPAGTSAPPPVPGRADQQHPSYNPTRSMQSQQQPAYPGQFTRRTPSNATSNSSTSTNTGLQRVPTNPGSVSGVRRSTSSRSNSTTSPTSYVALMRKQKATVWCDRAQHDDPRLLQAQRQAKMRAAQEVAGGHHVQPNGRTSTSSQGIAGGVRSKIRHHGAPKASAYSGTHLISSAGVPMRLSASEVDEGESDEEKETQQAQKYHIRNGSSRSSLGSGHRNNSYLSSHQYQQGGHSNGPSPTLGQSPHDSMGDLAEEETPTPNSYGQQDDYFKQPGGQGGSGGSSEREERFGNPGSLPVQRGGTQAEQNRQTSEELRRRGSVDDRTMTMSAGRLFVANPDLSD